MRPVRKFPIAPIFRALGGECGDFRTGRGKVRCPFHGDTRPSASIDYEKARFVCFACGVSGDAIDLLRTQEGLTWDAAVARAEALTGGAGDPVRDEPAAAPSLFDRPRSGRRG